MDKFILGGGVAGLVTAFYNSEYTIITDKVGGWQNANKFSLGPRFIEVTPASQAFMSRLGFTPSTRIVKIGYCDNTNLRAFSTPPAGFRASLNP